MSPSASNVRNVSDNIREETSGIDLHNSLKRKTSFSFIVNKTKNAHLLPKRATTLRIGHNSIIEFLSSFLYIINPNESVSVRKSKHNIAHVQTNF